MNGIPVVTAVAAWVFLDEKLTFIQAVGGVTVLVGVTFANARIGLTLTPHTPSPILNGC